MHASTVLLWLVLLNYLVPYELSVLKLELSQILAVSLTCFIILFLFEPIFSFAEEPILNPLNPFFEYVKR
jgi:hypothetical protein